MLKFKVKQKTEDGEVVTTNRINIDDIQSIHHAVLTNEAGEVTRQELMIVMKQQNETLQPMKVPVQKGKSVVEEVQVRTVKQNVTFNLSTTEEVDEFISALEAEESK